MAKSKFLTAQEAIAALGIKPATLYSYVSRGLVRSEMAGDSPREHRYWAEDIERLKTRKELRRNPAKTGEQSLHWGVPVLESGLTLIANGCLYYRGQDAAVLALESSLEEVASLLWAGEKRTVLTVTPLSIAPPITTADQTLGALHAFQAALVQAEADDPTAYDLRPERVINKGMQILQLFARIAARLDHPADLRVAQILQSGWAPNRPEATRLINAALVLCADHELNVSAFTARCVASAGASPYAAVIAGLAALQGIKHGGVSRRVGALFHEVGAPQRAAAVLSSRLQRGEAIPGFGHPLYPEGDPRAGLLLELVREAADARSLELSQAILEQARLLLGELPTIDFALVCLARALALPEDAHITLFAIGRTVGWIAHALEQYRTNALIRPRARYTGPQP